MDAVSGMEAGRPLDQKLWQSPRDNVWYRTRKQITPEITDTVREGLLMELYTGVWTLVGSQALVGVCLNTPVAWGWLADGNR